MAKHLLEISSLASIAERDIDLLLLEELNISEDFAHWFITRTTDSAEQQFNIIGSWHTISDAALGETDLMVLFNRKDEVDQHSADYSAILVENKIGASFQKDQAARYRKRGDKGIEQNWYRDYVTCLIAPEKYIQTHMESFEFDSQLTYEDIESWFRNKRTSRCSYRADIMKEAINQNRRGYQPDRDDRVTMFWSEYWAVATREYPELEMERPSDKPGRSTWPYFRRAGLPNGVHIIHKSEKGYVDLTFPNDDSGVLASRTTQILENDMEVTQTGKSAAIRLMVAAINMLEPFDDQIEQVRESLGAAARLREFYLKYQSKIIETSEKYI